MIHERYFVEKAKQEALIAGKNNKTDFYNGIYDRYEYPVLTREHAPIEWRYDINAETNPYFMERLGINAVMNSGAIMLNGKYYLIARVEGADRKSFFAVAESDNGVDGFRFWEYPVVLPDTCPEETNVYDMRLTQHEDGYIYGVFCSESKDTSSNDLSAAVAAAGIVRTKDLKTWERLDNLTTLHSPQQRNVVLHPEFVDGKYAFYTRPMDDFIDPKDALPIISKRTLCIVVDTYQVGLVESKDILEKCGKVAVIDHHRKGVGYIENPALVCHEPYSSSASELVTELLQYVGERDDKPNRVEAEGLLSGIMLDTRDFTLHTGVRTFEAAAALRRYGAETERVRQLFDVTMVEYNAKADLVEKARMYKNCAISVSGEVAPEARVAIAQAANDLLTIQGVDASFVAVQVGTGVNISARSLGAVNVQVIMESLGGGGHQTMAAAQLKHITPEAARARIEGAIDKYYASQKKGDVEGK